MLAYITHPDALANPEPHVVTLIAPLRNTRLFERVSIRRVT